MRTILVVDDEYLVRVGIHSFLNWEEHGYTIIGEAADGQSALDIIEKSHPDIVLTDLKMDGMDGFTLIEICKKKWPDILFVVLSSYDDGANVKRAMKLGAADYIFKVTSKPDELLKILDDLPYERTPDSMENVVRKNISGIKEQLIRNAAMPFYPDRQALQIEFSQLGLKTDFSKPYYVLMLDFGNSSTGAAPRQNPAVNKYALENMAQEVLSEKLQGEVYGYSDSTILAILQTDKEGSSIETCAEQAFTQLYSYTDRYLGVQLSGALSPCMTGMENLSSAITSCRKHLQTPTMTQGKGKLQTDSNGIRPEIDAVCRLVEENLQKDFTIKEVAGQCHMSESYFSHLFKKETGVSFVDFVNQRKIRKAEDLLRNTNMRINEVAVQIGIDNPNYFSVLFKKCKGESPQEYRLHAQNVEKER